MRHHSSHPLSTAIFRGLLSTKENVREWAYEHQKLLNDENSMEFPQVFGLCYDDLQLHLRRCLVSLAILTYGVYVSTKKLYDMWIAAGLVGTQQDTEKSLQKLACAYLYELVQRGMVNLGKSEPNGRLNGRPNGRDKIMARAKLCQLKFGLRDICLAKAMEDHTLNTQNLVLELDQMSVTPSSLKQQLSSHISFPLYNEDKWKLRLYICNHSELAHLRYLSLRETRITQLPSSLQNLTNLRTLDLRVMETIIIPDVLWKLKCLVHLYLPRDFEPHQTPKLQLSGLSCLQTLVNLDTDKVILKHLSAIKLLKKLSVRKIHEADAEELADQLAQLSTSLNLIINSQIINDDPTILATKFQYLKKLKIKGTISIELKPEIFPSQLEELILQYTNLEEDPLAILEKLPKLTRLFLHIGSFLGKKMKISRDFYQRANLMLSSLPNLETLYTPESDKGMLTRSEKIIFMYCPRLRLVLSREVNEKEEEEEADCTYLRLACLKKVLK